MATEQKRFRALVVDRIYEDFVAAPSRSDTEYTLVIESLASVTEFDAGWFVRTIELGVLTEVYGDFLAARSTATERIFNHGLKAETPRKLRIAIEPIIGIGALGRLIVEHGWSPGQLGLQPESWAFDLASYDGNGVPVIVGEVKTKASEVDGMSAYFERAFVTLELLEAKSENWNRKVRWLRGQPARVVWALGPGGYERIYKIERRFPSGMQVLVIGTRNDLQAA